MKNRSVAVLSLATLAIALGAGSAHAQDPMAPPPPPPPPSSEPAPPATAIPALALGGPELTNIMVPTGRVELRVPLNINMSSSYVGKPISIPLDVYYGVSDVLSVGLTHSGGTVQATSPYPLGSGLCLSGDTSGCPKVYNNVGLDSLYRFMGGTLQLAGHFGLDFRRISDPSLLSLRLGVLFQAPLGSNVALIVDPRIWFGLTKRDLGNKEILSIPLAVQFWVNPNVRLAARTNFGGPFSHFSDLYTGSLGAFGGFAITPNVEGFAAFDFLDLYGKNGSGDYRALVLGANIRI